MKYDDELKKALNLRAENFSVDENMLYSIKRKIKNQRRIGMNKFKKAVIVCCTVLVIGVLVFMVVERLYPIVLHQVL